MVARVEGRDFTLRRLDATNDLHVRIAQAIKAGLSGGTDPTRLSARQTHGRARASTRDVAVESARGAASETLAPEAPRTAPPDVLALVNALTQAAHALNGAMQGAQRGQGGPARQQTDRPERRSEPRPARDLLPPRQLGRTLPAEEVCKRAASDPRLGKYRAAVQAAAETAFKEPGPIVENLSRQAIEKPETIAAVRRQLYEKPRDWEISGRNHPVSGGRTRSARLLKRSPVGRARPHGPRRGCAVDQGRDRRRMGLLRTARADRHPGAERAAPGRFGRRAVTQAALAEVARNNDLVTEIKSSGCRPPEVRVGRDVLYPRGPRGRAAVAHGGIKEHDLEPLRP